MAAEVLEHVGPGIKEVFALANILIVGAIVYFGARKGVKISLKERSDTIAKRLNETRIELARMKAEVEKARQEISRMDQTKTQILSQVQEEAKRFSAQLVQEAEQSANRILTEASLTAKNEFQQASQKLREKLVAEALKQSAEIIRAEKDEAGNLRERIHERLLDKFVTELSAKEMG
jgi:F0F1-type ATP synthase membrane subunit b/b'